jgi:hypothetical protein
MTRVLIFSFIIFLVSCAPQNKNISKDSSAINLSGEEYIVAQGLYKIKLPWMWFDMTTMDLNETLDFAADRGYFDINSQYYKAFRRMSQKDQEDGTGANIFVPLNVLLSTYANDLGRFGVPNVSIAYSIDLYEPFTDEYIETLCFQKEEYWKLIFANSDFKMERCGRSNVLKGKNQMFTKMVNHPEKDFEQYIYSTYLSNYMVHSAVYTCHKLICDLYFPEVAQMLKSIEQYP